MGEVLGENKLGVMETRSIYSIIYNMMLDVEQVSMDHFYLFDRATSVLKKRIFFSHQEGEFEYNYAILWTKIVSDNLLFISESESI